MPLSRRHFLAGGLAAVVAACSSSGNRKGTSATATPAVTVPTTTKPANPLPVSPFTIGVASGDPDTTSVVLWTRLLGDIPKEQRVVWEVAVDERFSKLAAAGVVTATDDDAHSIHVVAEGLRPDTGYWYRFTADAHTSPVGRTRTTPDGDAARMRFAFASCQDWQDGLYTAHRFLAQEEIDLVVWLGDYIYETGPTRGAIRQVDTPTVTTLDGYRARYALYKSDPNLQAAHARAPWFVIWDDHEVSDNYANESPKAGIDAKGFPARRAAAYRAWWEHQPTRLPKPVGDSLRTYRALRWGGLATIVGLDGRQYRDDQPCDRGSDLGAGCPERDEPGRTMLGATQEAWVDKSLTTSRSAWNLIANQTIFSPSGIPLPGTEILNLDQWDGYPAARTRMLDVLARTSNPVIVTGDIHASAVGDVRRESDVVAVELVGPAISSTFPAQYSTLFETAGRAAGAAMVDAKHNGYVVCDVTLDALRAEYRFVSTTKTPEATISTSSSWEIAGGTPGIRRLT